MVTSLQAELDMWVLSQRHELLTCVFPLALPSSLEKRDV